MAEHFTIFRTKEAKREITLQEPGSIIFNGGKTST